MENYDDRYIMPFGVGNELSAESFRIAQSDQTYRLAAPRYQQFYASYIKPRISMYNGWIQGYHNVDYGILPSLFLQKIGNGILNTVFSKPVILNTDDPDANRIIEERFKKTSFSAVLKEAYTYALAGGTGMLKLNRDGNGNLRFEAIPMDRFFVETDSYGDIERVKCFLTTYHDTINAAWEYHLCEERFFRYTMDDGECRRFPMAHYTFYKTSSNVTNETLPTASGTVAWRDIPQDVRNIIERDYGDITVDKVDSVTLDERFNNARSQPEASVIYEKCTLLPFHDDLGCRLIKFTQNIPAFAKLPFGQPIADLLMNESYAYDQLKFFERTEVYIARGRVMVDDQMANPNDPDSRKKVLDSMIFTYFDNVMGDSKDGKPFAIQMELRAEAIRTQKQNILNDTAFALNLSSSTIAAWLSDGTSQKTATEIEYERTKTDAFTNEKVELIKDSVQDMVDMYFHCYGVTSPSVHIMTGSPTSRTESIRLHSELYDKGQIPAKKLAEEILGTCAIKEVNELSEYIEGQKMLQQAQPLNQSVLPVGGTDNVV